MILLLDKKKDILFIFLVKKNLHQTQSFKI